MVLAHNIVEGSRTQDIQINQDVTFDSMLLSPATLRGLQESGFYKPSPVQLHAIPLGKCGFDLLLEAKSGTGKTAVFSVIALEKLDLSKGLQVVILAPTREIASQICDVIRLIGSNYKGLIVEVVMGGLPVQEDISKFQQNVHIVVASPGRLRHLIQDKHINYSSVRLLVLDEADKLMEKSFLTDINYIFSILPHQKQVILSSATYPETTKSFITKYVKSAQHICPDSNCVLLGIEQKLTTVKFHANIVRQTQYRFEELLKILTTKAFKQCLIFCNYQARVTELHKLLTRHKWPVEQLYGQQEQTDRLGALKTLQSYKCRILISTDLAARGIDASNVDLVINFEPPFEWQTYLHRIGRAGRYGSYGMSITILSEGSEEGKFTTMIDSMKVPLNLGPFWTTDTNNLKVAQQIEAQADNSESILDDNMKYKELWKGLTNEVREVDNIENFETLCQSFEETKASVVESFDDLLISFQSKQNLTLSKDDYQHMTIPSTAIEDLSESLKTLKTLYENKKVEDIGSLKKSDQHIEKVKNIPNNVSSVTGTIDNSNGYKKIYNPLLNDIKEIPKDVKKGKCIKELLDQEKVTEFSLKDTTDLLATRALLDADLPSSFASKRNNICAINKRPCVPIASVKELKTRHNNSQNISTKTNNTNHRKHKIIINNGKNYEKYYHSKKHESEQSDSTDSACYSVSENYANWYKQLKFRMKQIELALYIEEINQLYL